MVWAFPTARARAESCGDQDTAVVGLWLEGRIFLNAGRPVPARLALEAALAQTRDASRRWLARDVRATLAAFPQGGSLG